MNRTIRTVAVTSTLPPVERTYLDDRGNARRDDRRSREALDVTTYVTTCSTQSQFRTKDGKLHAAGMRTVRLYGVQGVSEQPVPLIPRPSRIVDVAAAT